MVVVMTFYPMQSDAQFTAFLSALTPSQVARDRTLVTRVERRQERFFKQLDIPETKENDQWN